jgi:putative transposase
MSTYTQMQDGYAAFTHCHKERDAVIEYIKTQEEHPRRTTFRDELRRLLVEAGVEFDEKYLL